MSVPLRRVVLVDDHDLFRAGVRAELGSTVEVVGEAGSVAEAVPLIKELDPDVVLLDVRLGDENGLAVVEELSALTAVVILTAYDYPQYLHSALRLRAACFVGKIAPTEDLRRAVRRCQRGK